MPRIFWGIIALIALVATPAVAADIPLKAPAYKPAPASTWSGFYAGLEAGLQSTETNLTATNELQVPVAPILVPLNFVFNNPPTAYDGTGFRGGAFGGYNWQLGPQWVLGIEGDAGWADNKTTLGGVAIPMVLCCSNSFSSSVRTTWDASARARVGYLLTPNVLAYLTGGAAWQHVEENASCGPPFCTSPGFIPFSFTNSFTRTGWTVGGGIETALWPNWFLRASYRYADFGTVTFANTRVFVPVGGLGGFNLITDTLDLRLRTHAAMVGIGYRFGAPGVSAYAAEASPRLFYKAPPAQTTSWSGFYAGLEAGIRSTRTDATTTSAFTNGVPASLAGFAATEPLNGTAFRFGPYAGYNRQFAPQWVAGVEADWGWADRTKALPGFPFTPGFSMSLITSDSLAVKTTWDGSIRGRIGYLVTPTVLTYATGGAAWLHYDVTSACPGLCALPIFTVAPAFITNSTTRPGWTVGGGIEALLSGRWIARAEYRYADFGTQSFTLTRNGPGPVTSVVDNFDVRIRTHTALFGVAYKFTD